jgi:ubiquinone/menaquinone biosynthesis C-methylase UbiE
MFHPNGPTFLELAQQALSSTDRGYDLLAPKFDYTPFRTPDVLLRLVADHLGPPGRFGTGLDLCCGTGAAMRMLRPLCRERVVGIDRSQNMLAVGRQRTADAPGQAALEFVRGDALALPFGPVFDVVVCFGAFGHILRQQEPQMVREVARVLRPGGQFVFVTGYRPPLWSAGYWMCRLFNAAMHLRNFLHAPPFIMYYLTFLLPEAQLLLEQQGLRVEVRALADAGPLARYRLVLATRP